MRKATAGVLALGGSVSMSVAGDFPYPEIPSSVKGAVFLVIDESQIPLTYVVVLDDILTRERQRYLGYDKGLRFFVVREGSPLFPLARNTVPGMSLGGDKNWLEVLHRVKSEAHLYEWKIDETTVLLAFPHPSMIGSVAILPGDTFRK